MRWLDRNMGALTVGGVVFVAIGCGTDSSSETTGSSTSSSGASGAGGSSATSGSSASGSGGTTGESVTTGGGGNGSTVGGSGPGGEGGSVGVQAGSGGSSALGGAGGTAVDGGLTADAQVDVHVPGDGGPVFDGTLFYVTADDGSLYAYQTGTWMQVGKWSGLPILDGVRGSDIDVKTGILYLTHGGAGTNNLGGATSLTLGSKSANGSLLAWNLVTNKVVFDVHFNHGVDQLAVGDGLVYVPAGEFTDDTAWYYYKTSDGSLVGTEPGGRGPHDSLFLHGNRYYGGTQDTFLYVLGLALQPIKVGPSPSNTAGVRPFTVNAAETRMYITWSAFRGFSVAELPSGRIISTVKFGQPCDLAAPSHGMTLSPDGTEVYVLDTCVNQLRVYDSSDDPKLRATIDFAHKMYPGTEKPCAWDCAKDGWLLHSRNGKYVYIGNSGDIIDTATHQNTAYLSTLAECRHGFLEIMWSNGVITGTSTHTGIGY